MADSPEIPKILADNPAAAQRYLRMVAAVGGVPDVGDVVDDLVLEALYGPYEEVDPDNPNFVRWRYPEVEEGALADLPSGVSPDSEGEPQDYGQDDRPRHGVPTQDWLSRGLKHPAGRGWEAASDGGGAPGLPAARPGGLYGGLPAELPSHPTALDPAQQARPFCEVQYEAGFRGGARGGMAGAGGPRASAFPAGWQPGDPPLAYALEAPDPYSAPYSERSSELLPDEEGDGVPARWATASAPPAAKFDAPARARFLDALATSGNVRASAARVGVSRETAYRARRRYPDFAQLWDAALVEARAHAAGELASYALDGVPQPVLVRGELIATWRRIDARLLLAHMARLDRFAEANPRAVHAAARFDALLAAHLGQEADALMEETVEARSTAERASLGTLPPTREEVMRHAAGEALWAGDAGEDMGEGEVDSASARAGEAWDRAAEAGHALVDAALDGAALDGTGDREREAAGRNRAASVNPEVSPAGRAPPSRCRAGSAQARSRRRG